MSVVHLITDEPVDSSGDGLGFRAYARTLANAAKNTTGPLTIGVFGEWGSGKSSLMRMIQEELGPSPEIAPVWFNVWKYEREEHPIVPLIGTIVDAIEARTDFNTRLAAARVLEHYGRRSPDVLSAKLPPKGSKH